MLQKVRSVLASLPKRAWLWAKSRRSSKARKNASLETLRDAKEKVFLPRHSSLQLRLQLWWHFLLLMKWRWWRLTRIQLLPLTSTFHVSHHLRSWRDSVISIYYTKPLSPFIMQSPKSHEKWVVLRIPTQVWWWENLKSFHYSTASIDEKNPSLHWTSYLDQKEFPGQNCKVGFLMKQVHCLSFSVALRCDPDLKDQFTKLSWVVGFTLCFVLSSL